MAVQEIGTDTTTFRAEWRRWHDEHERVRADGHGFLAISGLHWLSDQPQRFAGAPGEWSTGHDGVVLLGQGEEITVAGERVRGRHVFGVLPERGDVKAGWGDAVIGVAKRGGFDIVRPRHPDYPVRVTYAGTPAFPPDPRWRLRGRYI